MLKAFRLNDTEAWAGTDLEDAIARAIKACDDCPRHEVFEEGYGEELSLDHIVAGDEDEPGETVREILKNIAEYGPTEGPAAYLVCEFVE
jgi:hypothetical protein